MKKGHKIMLYKCILLLQILFFLLSSYEVKAEVSTIKEDGMVFHAHYPPKTNSDMGIRGRIDEIEMHLEGRRYEKAGRIVDSLLDHINNSYSANRLSAGNLYSINYYKSLKHWKHMISIVKKAHSGDYSNLKRYSGEITSIKWGMGRSSSGYINVSGEEGDREFFGESNFLIEKGGVMKIGKKVELYYEETGSLDNPFMVIVILMKD